jgi:hypothetical protein
MTWNDLYFYYGISVIAVYIAILITVKVKAGGKITGGEIITAFAISVSWVFWVLALLVIVFGPKVEPRTRLKSPLF